MRFTSSKSVLYPLPRFNFWRTLMGQPVIHWQIVTRQPEKLQQFYAEAFGWDIDANNALGYRTVDTGCERGIDGGIWPAPPEAADFVQLFIEVDDVPATARKV